MFSHAHFLVNFMGIANAAFMIPATTNSDMPVVASDMNDLHFRGGVAAGAYTAQRDLNPCANERLDGCGPLPLRRTMRSNRVLADRSGDDKCLCVMNYHRRKFAGGAFHNRFSTFAKI